MRAAGFSAAPCADTDVVATTTEVVEHEVVQREPRTPDNVRYPPPPAQIPCPAKPEGGVSARSLIAERTRVFCASGDARKRHAGDQAKAGLPMTTSPRARWAGAHAAELDAIRAEWRDTPASQALSATRPPLGSAPESRDAWERQLVAEAQKFVEDAGRAVFETLAQDQAMMLALAASPSKRGKPTSAPAPRGSRMGAAQTRFVNQEHFQTWTQLIFSQKGGGDSMAVGVGVLRQQTALLQVLLQDAGIDSRMSVGPSTPAAVDGEQSVSLTITLSSGSQILLDPLSGPSRPLRERQANTSP